ncbi:hypothetical protein HDU98_007693 [Podochytrium sp. JEL0797]|nr:hypothetical protein HDU98_007693 [Podochytrium sp. JEL0797]
MIYLRILILIPVFERLVQTLVSGHQMDVKIAAFVRDKKASVDESNRNEFVSNNSSSDSTCARVDAVEINRNMQMKIDLAVNEHGPLDRSTHKGETANEDNSNSSTKNITASHLQQRLSNMEQHLRINYDPNSSAGIHQRVKILEDTIIQLEERYPCWSAVHFDHSTNEFPEDPFGPSIWTGVRKHTGGSGAASSTRYIQTGQTVQASESNKVLNQTDKSYADVC